MMLSTRDALRACWIVSIVLRFVFGALIVTGVLTVVFMLLIAMVVPVESGPGFGPCFLPLLQIALGAVGFLLSENAAKVIVPMRYRCPACLRPLPVGTFVRSCPGCSVPLRDDAPDVAGDPYA